MTTVYLFNGQGAEVPEMGLDFYHNSLIFKRIIDRADAVLAFDLPAYLFGAAPLLDHPDWLQPAVVAYSVALYQAVAARADYLVGLSLGEYSALIASGMLDLESGLRLVQARGQAMAAAAQASPGGMLAILKSVQLPDIPDIWLANHNSPKQLVVGGTPAGLAALSAYLTAEKIRFVTLPVAGAFHTPLMAAAETELAQALATTDFSRGKVSVLSTTALVPFTIDNVRATLQAQVKSPTQFMQTVLKLRDLGATDFIELGPKPVLSRLVKQIDKQLATTTISTFEEARTLDAISG